MLYCFVVLIWNRFEAHPKDSTCVDVHNTLKEDSSVTIYNALCNGYIITGFFSDIKMYRKGDCYKLGNKIHNEIFNIFEIIWTIL